MYFCPKCNYTFDVTKTVLDSNNKVEIFGITQVPSIEEMLREKRMRWFGHLVREKTGDPAKATLYHEMDQKSKWWRQLLKDFKMRKMTVEEAMKLALDKPAWRWRSSCLLELSGSTKLSRLDGLPR